MPVSIERVFVGEQPVLEFELVDQDGAAIDLSGLVVADINVLLRLDGAAANLYASTNTNATAINADPTTGKFTWRWPAVIPAAQAGNVKGQVKVKFAATHIRATDWFNLNVDAGLLA
jgi:hypothetical protein